MGYTFVQILHWVVNLRICFDLSNLIFSVRAKYSGVTMECLEFATTLLIVPFWGTIFTLALLLLIWLGTASFTLIDDTNPYSAVSTTSELVTNPKIRWLTWKKSVGLTLLRFLYISATHDSSQYGMFLSIVTFTGSHYTLPSINTMCEKFLICGLMTHRCWIILLSSPYWMVGTFICGIYQFTGSYQTGCWILGYQMIFSGLGWWVRGPSNFQIIGPNLGWECKQCRHHVILLLWIHPLVHWWLPHTNCDILLHLTVDL